MLIEENRSSFLNPPKPTCDARQFNYGDIFFTNVSIFDYTIAIIDGSNGFLYSGAPLSEICSVGYYGVIVDKTQSTVQGGVGLVHPPMINNKLINNKYWDFTRLLLNAMPTIIQLSKFNHPMSRRPRLALGDHPLQWAGMCLMASRMISWLVR